MSRASRLGERFLSLGEFDLLYIVNFKLTSRRCIYQVLEQMDKQEQPCLDLFFAIQHINVHREDKDDPIFLGAFEYASDPKLLEEQLQGVEPMDVMRVQVMTVGALFEAMSRTSYREYQMFERLKFGSFFSRSSTFNPFAHAVLARDVLHINNLAQQQNFCQSQYKRFIRSKRHKYTIRSSRQKDIQIALYGETSRHYQIYLSPQDLDSMKIRQDLHQDSKMEDCMSTSSNEGMREDSVDSYSSSSSSGIESESSSEDRDSSEMEESESEAKEEMEEASGSEDEMEVIEKLESLHIRGRSVLAGYDSEDELSFKNGLSQSH